MAWTTPVDQATGFLVTAAVYNAQIIDNLSYLHGDSGALIDVSAGAQFLQAAGLILGPTGTTDTRLNRQAPGQASVLGSPTTNGTGNLILGGLSANVAGGGTFTPDAARFLNRFVITSVGTVTIAAPTNPPSGNESALICLLAHNASGGSPTLSWNAAYANSTIFTAPANGQATHSYAVWSSATSHWVIGGGSTGYVD